MPSIWQVQNGVWIPEQSKYLVVRRDGTTPKWPHFVLGAADPCAPAALLAYSAAAQGAGYDHEYWGSVDALATIFEKWQEENKQGDPPAPRHRKDNAFVVQAMSNPGCTVNLYVTDMPK